MNKQKLDSIIYDADCGFCQRSVELMKKITGDVIDYIPSYKIEDGFYGISKESTASSIKFLEHREKDGETLNKNEKVQHYEYHDIHEDLVIYHGAYAIFKALNSNPIFSPLLFLYKWLPFFSVIAEAIYRIIARNRMHISKAIGADACKI